MGFLHTVVDRMSRDHTNHTSLLKENQILRGLISDTLSEVEGTQRLMRDFIGRLDSILTSIKKKSNDDE